MLSLRDFWRRHKRKIFVTAGVLGSGYLLYKVYNAHKIRVSNLEKEFEGELQTEELIKAQMQAHFENIQRIANTATLPHAIHYLSNRIEEELDLLHLTERLMKGKGQPNTLTLLEKLELWDRLKILSFTKMVASLWVTTMISLYIRVQVNILGRHLYIDTARDLGGSHLLEEADPIDSDDQQKFLATADFLSTNALPILISNMQVAVTEALKGKQLRDTYTTPLLRETIVQVLDMFMSNGSPHQWIDYLMPSSSNGGSPDSKFDQLMVETRLVLSSSEFDNVVEISLKTVVEALMEETEIQIQSSGIPLAKLLPRVAQMGPLLLEEPDKNRFIRIIRNIPEVELFFTLLYADMPSSTQIFSF